MEPQSFGAERGPVIGFRLGLGLLLSSALPTFALWQNLGNKISLESPNPNASFLNQGQGILQRKSVQIEPWLCTDSIACAPALWNIYQDSIDHIGIAPLYSYSRFIRPDSGFKDRSNRHEMGLFLSGQKGPISFWLDGRIYAESHTNPSAPSLDGQVVEVQNTDSKVNQLDYSSYSRMQGSLDWSGNWGHLGWRRLSPKWGPARLHGLLFSGQEYPFAHFLYQGNIGPIRFIDLWGQLSIDGQDGYFRATRDQRSLYAHRFEWELSPQFTLGFSEQLILFNFEEPSALIPMVPLFMLKTDGIEDDNNGLMAFDAQWISSWNQAFYGEFLIDDLSDPASLFNSFWKNRWALSLGSQWSTSAHSGWIAEFCRIEPWVYTHYYPFRAQAVHRNLPLGEALGPNSMQFSMAHYSEWPWLGLQLQSSYLFKGKDLGSSIYDSRPDSFDPNNYQKTFLAAPYDRYWQHSLVLYKQFPWLDAKLRAEFGRQALFEARFSIHFP